MERFRASRFAQPHPPSRAAQNPQLQPHQDEPRLPPQGSQRGRFDAGTFQHDEGRSQQRPAFAITQATSVELLPLLAFVPSVLKTLHESTFCLLLASLGRLD